MQICRAVCFLILGLMPAYADQDDIKALKKSLAEKYKGKAATLRNFYSGSKLLFDSNGNLVMLASLGSWTTSASVEIQKLELNDKKLVLQGRRVLHRYSLATKSMVEVRRFDQKLKLSNQPDPFKLRAEIALIKGPGRESALSTALEKIFLKDTESIADVAPPFWKSFLSRQTVPNPAELKALFNKNEDKSKVVPPKAVRNTMPHYTIEALMFRVEGIVLISCIVDENGKVKDPKIISPLGLGLDESAVREMMENWKFLPGSRDGQPAAIQANIEVSFRLY
jgi:TonB family protein